MHEDEPTTGHTRPRGDQQTVKADETAGGLLAPGEHVGRYVRYPSGTPLANLHLTLLDKLGVRVESFGDSTGVLDNLGDQMLGDV